MPTNKAAPLHPVRACQLAARAVGGSLLLSLCSFALAQSIPAGQPQPPAGAGAVSQSTGASSLKFRDPAMPLTIGEISDMQAAKARAELLSKFGYTEHKPEVVKPVSNTQVAKTASPEKRRLQITALAVWGKGNAFQAETMVNGRVTTVKGGEFLAPGVKVEQVLAHTVVLSVQSPMTKDARGRLQPAEVRQQSLSIGKPSEIEL